MVIKALLIVPVASFHLAVVPRCSGADRLVLDPVSVAENIQRMDPIRLFRVCKLSAVVGLQYLRSVSEKGYGTLEKIYC